MGLTRVAILRPLFIAMVFLSIVVVGAISYSRLGVDLFPAIDFPVVTVVTVYPGASPESVETLVTIPVEDAVSGIANLDYMQSSSSESLSIVTLVFTDRANSDTVAIDVERRVNAIRSQLPSDAELPNVVRYDVNAQPVMNLALSGELPPEELSRLAEDQILPRLNAVDGVASVVVVGDLQREIQVRIDQDRLRARGLSIAQVASALAQENVNVPGGTVVDGGRELNVRLDGLYSSPEQLRRIVVASTPAGAVYLGDVAEVQDAHQRRTQLNRASGRESIGLLITKEATANTLAVTDGVKEAIESVRAALPSGAQIDVITDASVFTRESIESLRNNLIEAVLLTGLVLLAFLHTWRSTVIVLLAIPTSLIATIAVMYFLGFTLNMMSMMGLALVIGILVDDSIVVLENIYRHLHLGETPFTAALKGRSEIGLAAIAITLVDVVVFTPVAFMSGITGQYFRQFGLVVAVATLFSLFVSFTLTPMLASRWLRASGGGNSPLAVFGRYWEAGYDWLADRYRSLLRWALRLRWAVIAIGVLSFVAGLGLVAFNLVSTELLPEADQAEFTLLAEMPPGTALDETNAAIARVEERLAAMPEVVTYFTSVGVGGDDRPDQSRYARIVVKLVPAHERAQSVAEIASKAREFASDVPGLTLRSRLPSVVSVGGQPISIQIRGDDRQQLAALAEQVAAIVAAVPGTRDVTNSASEGQPEIVVRLDRDRAADLGITAGQAASLIRTAINGSVVSQYRPSGDTPVDIRVMASEDDVQRVDRLRDLPLLTNRGTTITLGQIATLEEVAGPSTISRRDRERVVTIGADLVDRPLGDVAQDIQEQLDQLVLPPGYTIGFVGESEAQDESFGQLFEALGLSVLLMYMLMVALYESLLYPFVIMLSLPLAAVGALGALALTDTTLNMVSMIGLILLTGLVGKNAILLVDYTNTLRRRGMARNAAILEAGPTRLRPILMTTAAMVIAMLPVAFGHGQGSELRAPMAIVVIGGLLTSTLLTLVFIPAVYTVFDDLQAWVGRLVGWRGASVHDQAEGVDALIEPRAEASVGGET